MIVLDIVIIPNITKKQKKMASYSYRTAQPSILAAFLPWGGSIGAGRIRLAAAKVRWIFLNKK